MYFSGPFLVKKTHVRERVASKTMDADLIVVGAGLVGAALALALGPGGLKVTVVEAAPPPPAPEGWDSRMYALSPGSRDLLASIGAWDLLDADRIEPVTAMAVHGDRAGAHIDFDALDSGVPALAYIVEGGAVSRALWQRLQEAAHVSLRTGARPASLAIDARAATLTLRDGAAVRAPLVVGADGAESWVRESAGIAVRTHPYGQRAVVANFHAARDHGGVARQWFRADGVLALLPLPGQRVSMVWSTDETSAEALMGLDSPALAARVAEAAAGATGDLEVITPAVAFALQARVASRLVQPRLALVGDAAHNLHPLAGQGVNLGFRDVRVLAATLAARGPEGDVGVAPLLRRYERARREDIATMFATTDGLQRLFASRVPGAAMLRNTGLNLAGRLPWLKSLLAQQALA
jgi:ubiquinone biosynthesis UbiH/UbiF/VisC/COQ6 family hydroxylase